MAIVRRYKATLNPDVLMARSKMTKDRLPLGPVFVEHEGWFQARHEACRLLLASPTEMDVVESPEPEK